MSVTIYDIADRAGVSIATVSRVFSGRGAVAERTRRRVFAVAEELGYKPNASARSLARRKTRVVAAVVPMLTSYFFMELVRGVQDRLREDDYDLLVYTLRTPDRADGQLSRAAQRGRADGVLLCSIHPQEEEARMLHDSGLPVVLVDAAHAEFDCVCVNNREGGYLATKHLLDRGFRRIAFLAPDATSVPGLERRAGYEAALREDGVEVDEALVISGPEKDYDGYSPEAGYRAMRELLARDGRPEAVFAASDAQALGALKAVREAGLRVPDDLALIGFDDIQTSDYAGLSTLQQPTYEMGRVAAGKL
ncbi:MAG: LacI family DNA-binding transcriptional regulator, partial [Rhodothermales bacterium]|nr:LacI family DNA-binding transcriptional regulator [Rhodothermales bacterium]